MKTIRCLFNILFCLLPFLLSAQTPAIHSGLKPDWVTSPKLSDFTPSKRDIDKGYFLSEVEQQIHVEKQARYVRIIRGIVTEAGIQNGSEISVSFDPTFEKLDFHQITVWRAGKASNRLQLSKFKIMADEKDLSNFIYQGTYNAYLILDDIRKGDRIEYSFTITGRNPIFKNKFVTSLYLQEYQPVSHNYNSVLVSPNRKLNFKYINGAAKGKVSSAAGLVRYEWEDFKQKAIEYEDNTPAWFYTCPTVQISEYQSWAEVAAWANEINPANAHLKDDAGAFVAKLKTQYKTDKNALFRAAVQFVQDEVRYMGVENGEYSHRAGNPEKIFNQRYGDCKDKALLLVSLLRSVGFEANIALVNTTEKERVANYLPTPISFDHAVVCALVNGKKVWVDATMQYQGGKGDDIYFPDYRMALIVNPATTNLTNIEKKQTGVYTLLEQYTTVDNNTPVTLKVKTIYSLDGADDFRASLATKSMVDREKEYLKYYQKLYPKIQSTDTLVVQDDRKKNVLTTIESYLITDFFTRDSVSGAFRVPFYSNYIDQNFPTVTGQRKHPLHVNANNAIEHVISVVMPGGWNIDTETETVNNDFYKFHSYYSSVGDTLSLRYQFQFIKGYVPANKSARFASDLKKLEDDNLGYTIIYTPDSVPFYPNYHLIAYGFVFLLVLMWAAYFKYHQVSSTSIYHKAPVEIGGWLIVIMLALAISALVSVKDIIDGKYLDLNTWEFHSARESSVFYKVLLTLKVFSKVYIATFATFCLVLMIGKRDILPKLISVYFGTAAILITLEYVLSSRLYGDTVSSFDNVMYAVISSFLTIYYFRTSEQVKETFVVSVKAKREELV